MVNVTQIQSAISALECMAEKHRQTHAVLMGALALTDSEDETVRALINLAIDDLSDIRYRLQIKNVLSQLAEVA